MKLVDFERDDRVFDFTNYALTAEKNHYDEWMDRFVELGNKMLKGSGYKPRIRYDGGEIKMMARYQLDLTLIGLVEDGSVFFLLSHVLEVKKHNTDKWMVELVKRANAVFLKCGEETRLQYKNGEILQLIV